MRLQLSPKLADDSLSFDILLRSPGKSPFSIIGQEVYFYGQVPLWVCWKNGFYPVQTGLPPQLVSDIVQQPPFIPTADVSEFLDRVWTHLPMADLYGQEEFLVKMQPFFVPANYDPKIFLDEEGSLLTLQVQNVYQTEHGEISVSGPNPDLMTASYLHEGKSYLIARDCNQEQDLITMLLDMRFQPRNNANWFLETEEAIVFLLDAYPKLVEKYRVYGEKNLTRYKVRLSKPVIVAEVESKEDEKWFNLDLEVQYDDQRVPIEKIWKAWTQGKRYVQLKDGSYTSLPESWLESCPTSSRPWATIRTSRPRASSSSSRRRSWTRSWRICPRPVPTRSGTRYARRSTVSGKSCRSGSPRGCGADLRPYQVQGLSYLNFLREYGFGGILADEMGLGKTIQTLAFIQFNVERGDKGPQPHRRAHLGAAQLGARGHEVRARPQAPRHLRRPARILIQAHRRVRPSSSHLRPAAPGPGELLKFEFSSIILDEAQNIKNPNTITARSVRRLTGNTRLCLSGTPIENNPVRAVVAVRIPHAGLFGRPERLPARHRQAHQGRRRGDPRLPARRVRPFILRRTKSEVAKDLPPKVETSYYLRLARRAARTVRRPWPKKLKEKVLATVDEKGMAKSQMSILDALLKLRQICCHPRLLKSTCPASTPTCPRASSTPSRTSSPTASRKAQGAGLLPVRPDAPYHPVLDDHQPDAVRLPRRFEQGPASSRWTASMMTSPSRSSSSRSRPAARASTSPAPTTSSTTILGGTPPWKTRPPTGPTGSGQLRQVFSYKMICQNTVEKRSSSSRNRKRTWPRPSSPARTPSVPHTDRSGIALRSLIGAPGEALPLPDPHRQGAALDCRGESFPPVPLFREAYPDPPRGCLLVTLSGARESGGHHAPRPPGGIFAVSFLYQRSPMACR